jgi:hypothetical protein
MWMILIGSALCMARKMHAEDKFGLTKEALAAIWQI